MFDIQLDKATGDWMFSPNLDIRSVKLDEDVVGQRIWTRLRIGRGWINDPSGGLLGSRLRSSGMRIPRNRALVEIPLYIEEALAPMHDVRILDISVIERPDGRSVWAHITYQVTDPGDPRPLPAQVTQTLNVEIRLQ
jgi:phage gp46-like protein